ncbi:MAG TPA: 23S rRNA (uracil(1939)-C(5))-methyltransferase RlmD [Flavobacteriales bacterium]|nr:23S rRNA (uracil(1939)-C(5))-methyltransferase RlmD [Flavobacteriales bacterium]
MGKQKMFRKGEFLEVTITGSAYGGKGIAKIPTEKGDFTVFVQNTFPGQKVNAQVVKCKNRYAECSLRDILEPSTDEIDTPYQTIPGAPYASFPIELQHKYKEESAIDLFERIGGIKDVRSLYKGMVDSPSHWHYRNKMEYSFSEIRHDLESGEKVDDFGLGFKHRGTWWAVENLDRDSGLFDKQIEDDLHKVRKWCEKTGLPAWHPPKREGFFRFFVIRRSVSENTILINLVTTSGDKGKFVESEFVEFILGLWGDRVAGILHTINDDIGERVEAREGSSKMIYGLERITETLHGLKFDISLSSFFQTNPLSAERLYAEVIALAVESDMGGKDAIVLDLFCGTGTISQLLAQHHEGEIIGVDMVESAIEDARISAKRNGAKNVTFYAADVGKFLLEYPQYRGRIRTLVMDPPRAGISPKSLRKVIRLQADRMVYVSCNPATQARDMATLAENGYKLVQFKLIDQFPHTSHVECVAMFERIPGFVTKIDLNK